MSRWITADLDSSFVQKYVSDYWRVALGSAWFQKQSWRQWGTEGAERFLTVKGWAPGIQSRRIRATGATPLKRSRRRRKMNSLSRAIKSNATHTVMCVCVCCLWSLMFFLWSLPRTFMESVIRRDIFTTFPAMTFLTSLWNCFVETMTSTLFSYFFWFLFFVFFVFSREDIRTANVIAAEAVTCLVIDREWVSFTYTSIKPMK